MKNSSFVVMTRFFESRAENAETALEKLYKFVDAALLSGAKKVFVAVNAAEDKSGALEATWPEHVIVFGVSPWGKFITPLNALLLASRQELAQGAVPLFASAEVVLTPKIVTSLLNSVDDNTAVVGAAMLGHNYTPGFRGQADGRNVPWNTLAVWNPKFLYTVGFPVIGDGIPEDASTAGVEELATLAVIQTLYPNTEAKMILIDGISWDTSGFDADRLQKHEAKMASKVTRPAQQLAWAGLNQPRVNHI